MMTPGDDQESFQKMYSYKNCFQQEEEKIPKPLQVQVPHQIPQQEEREVGQQTEPEPEPEQGWLPGKVQVWPLCLQESQQVWLGEEERRVQVSRQTVLGRMLDKLEYFRNEDRERSKSRSRSRGSDREGSGDREMKSRSRSASRSRSRSGSQ